MPSFNRCIFAGHLTRDPELKTTGSGDVVASFGLAINRKWKGADGQPREEVCFIECSAWQKRGELIGQYFNKGSPILVEGRLKLDQWETDDGQKRSKHTLVVEQFSFVGGRAEKDGEEAVAPSGGSGKREPMKASVMSKALDDDDIPF